MAASALDALPLRRFLALSSQPALSVVVYSIRADFGSVLAAPALDAALNRRLDVSRPVDPESSGAQAAALTAESAPHITAGTSASPSPTSWLQRRQTDGFLVQRPAGPRRMRSYASDESHDGESTSTATFSDLLSPQHEVTELSWMSGQRTQSNTGQFQFVYPHIHGPSADRGRGTSLRTLTTPVWGNDAWRRIIRADGTERGSLFDLLGGRDGVRFTRLLAEACAAPRDATPAAPSSIRVGLHYELRSPHALGARETELELVATRVDEDFVVVTAIVHGAPASNLSNGAPPILRRTASVVSTSSVDGSRKRRAHEVDQTTPTDESGGDRTMADVEDLTPQAKARTSDDYLTSRSATGLMPSDPLITLMGETVAGQQIRDYPWESTPVGAISTWSGELRASVSRMLKSPWREALWVGEDMTVMYGETFRASGLSKDGWIMGKRGAVAYGEIWDQLVQLVPGVQEGKTEVRYDALLLLGKDGGRIHETYFTWAWIPVFDSKGKFVAASNPSIEATARVITERRLGTLRDVVQTTALARRIPEFCKAAIAGLARNPYDCPFAMIYSVRQAAREGVVNRGASRHQHVQLDLEASIGVPEGHASMPMSIRLRASTAATPEAGTSSSSGNSSSTDPVVFADDQTLPWPFHEAVSTGKPVFVQDATSRLAGFVPRGWDEQCRSAIVLPIGTSDEDEHPQALIIVGLNPRRDWDETYAIFFQLLGRQLATGLATVLSYEQAQAKADEMRALDMAKSAFFQNSSHELRTPLTLILGPLDDVLREQRQSLPPAIRSTLQICHRNAQRLLGLVNGLLDFSRLEAGRTEAVFTPVALGPLVANLCALFRSAIERNGIAYSVQIEETPATPKVYTDVTLFEKVLNNIVGNAAKYTQAGRIDVTLRYSSTEAILSVSDTGCGIAESEIERIFDRFHRVETTAHAIGGTGIGLAFASEVIRILGGQIGVKSQVNKGSTFYVRLQLGSAHLDPERIRDTPDAPLAGLAGVRRPSQDDGLGMPSAGTHAGTTSDWAGDQLGLELAASTISQAADTEMSSGSGESSSAADATQGPAAMLNVRKSTILVVDDNADMRAYCRSVLPSSYTIYEAHDGLHGLEEARRLTPDLIISDIMMPRMNGIELISALREAGPTQLIPVILLSARAGPEARVDGLMSGADDYLAKPFSARELVARVSTHLQLGKIRKELDARVVERTAALADSERHSRDLADKLSSVCGMVNVGIWFSSARTIHYANPKWYEMTGMPVGSDQHWEPGELSTHPEDRAMVSAYWRRAVDERVPATFDFRYARPGESDYSVFHASVRPQEVLGHFRVIGSLTDVTLAKQLELDAIREVEERAQEATRLRKLQELSIDVSSHELRNPLSGIVQNAALIADSLTRLDQLATAYKSGATSAQEMAAALVEELSADAESIESIQICARHQRRIADDILSFSKLNIGLFTIQRTQIFNPIEMARGVVRMFSADASQRGVKLTLAIDESIERLRATGLTADAHRLSQVLINYLTNALRFTSDAGGGAVEMSVRAAESLPDQRPGVMRVTSVELPARPENGVWLVVAVRDTGPGLDPSEQSRLFHRFAQANPQIDSLSGFGLGLFVSRKIVELHDGFIEVDSARGRGSVFSLAIPASRAELPQAPTRLLVPPPTSSTPLISPTSPRPSSQGDSAPPLPRVLVVEDNSINARVLMRQLQQNQFTPSVAVNGLKALEALQAVDAASASSKPVAFECVLMDIEMPVLDGLSAIRRLREVERAIPQRGHARVIAVTGNARDAQIEACKAAGFDAVAVKPYSLQELLAQIRDLIAPAEDADAMQQ